MLNKKLSEAQKRCQDCACLVIKGGVWCCDECFGQKCEDIDDCPEGVELEEIEALEEKAKTVKINHQAKAEKTPKERKPREPKGDPIKEKIVADFATFAENFAENVQITNKTKIIEFDFEGNHYKLDLIRQKKPKN